VTVTVPSSDTGNFQLQAQIAALQTAVTANTATAAVQAELVAKLDDLQQQLVRSLMANATNRTPGSGMTTGSTPSFMTASHILSSQTINT